jgi:Rrf2 family protein
VQSADVTERQDIPPRYLEPILQRLGRAGILVGIRGPSGGYRLARERRRITLWDLVVAARVDEADDAPAAKTGSPGPVLQAVLDDIESHLKENLQAITIEDLCWKMKSDEMVRARRASPDFAI